AEKDDDRNKDAVKLAFDLWDEVTHAQVHREDAAAKLRELIAGIYKFPPLEWRARVDEYHGHRKALADALTRKTYPVEVVAKQLFRDNSIAQASRVKML